jgi:hypothetical protein
MAKVLKGSGPIAFHDQNAHGSLAHAACHPGNQEGLAKLGDTIMGGAVASVPEHYGKRARATIRSDADFDSGAGSADRSPAAARRLAATLPCGP